MTDISIQLKTEILRQGADLVGFGSLSELPPDVRQNLPFGVSVAVKYPKEVIRGIHDFPTRDYFDHYHILNDRLDALAEFGAAFLQQKGFTAIPQTRAYVEQFETNYTSLLPHKTVATRAGVGWIGKCALLVTESYGSMIRISSILTDAPLFVADPINESKCGDCNLCTGACPAGAVSGKLWRIGFKREDFFDAVACRKTARERAVKGFGIEITQCGKCIEACPYTRRHFEATDET
jgi:epoxyqueuosine reductase QueG